MRYSLALLLLLGRHEIVREPTRADVAAEHQVAGTQRDLIARNRVFLEAVRSHRASRIAAFFPRRGTFEYVFTEHTEHGDRRQSRRIAARAARREIADGALWASFNIQYEGQPIGLLAHQVMHRGTEWRLVGRTRFVPPGEDRSADIFVEWRREGSAWVVSAYGDERYSGFTIPPWCC